MSSLFLTVVAMSVKASLLIAMVLVARSLCRNWVAPGWIHGLWLLVLLRLAVPWWPPAPWSAFNGFNSSDSSLPIDLAGVGAGTIMPAGPPAAEPAWLWLAAWVWMAGFLILGLRLLVGSGLFWLRIRELPECRNEQLLRHLAEARATLQTRRHVSVVETHGVNSPAIFGIRSPRILLPVGFVESCSADDLRFVLLHELAHLKRLDVVTQMVVAFLRVVHWFNPWVGYGLKRMGLDREVACDHLVLEHLGHDMSKPYGEALLRLVNVGSEQLQPHAIGLLETFPQLKRRLHMIRRKNELRHSPILTFFLVAGLAAFGLTEASAEIGSATPASTAQAPEAEALDAQTLLTIELPKATVGAVIEEIETQYPQLEAKVSKDCAGVELEGGFQVEEEPFVHVVARMVEASGCRLEHLSYSRLLLTDQNRDS